MQGCAVACRPCLRSTATGRAAWHRGAGAASGAPGDRVAQGASGLHRSRARRAGDAVACAALGSALAVAGPRGRPG
eukprot:11471446-Alexandrium_andersonii.AAC.1